MNEQLIRAINAYTSTLEQQMAALEARIAQLEQSNLSLKRECEVAKALVVALQEKMATMSFSESANAEPEVEIELVLEEDDEVNDLEKEVVEELETVLEESLELPLVAEEPTKAESVTLEIPVAVDPTSQVVAAEAPKKAGNSVSAQTSLFGAPVDDVRQAISLGDRFLFQRELFAGNGELMQKALAEINSLDSYDEALEYIQENFDWDVESTAVKLFDNVLKRRFGN